MIFGALINAGAILAGGGLGLLLKGRINEKFSQGLMRAMGLCVIVIGVAGGLGGDVMLMVLAMGLGAVLGEVLHIDDGLNRLGQWVQAKMGKSRNGSLDGAADEKSTFAKGFVAASLLFCVGAMAVVGSIDAGLRGDYSVVMAKSIIDAVAAMALASTFGVGVLFSAFMVLIYQGMLEFFAGYLQDVFTASLVTQISAVGGVMILAIGTNMAIDSKIKVANLLPGFLFAAGYYYLFLRGSI